MSDCGLTGLTFSRPSLCKTHFAADCDLSNIVRKFIRTGELPRFRERPNIGDASAFPGNYQELQDSIAFAKSQFALLPPEEREKYQNSPELWLESQFLANREINHEQKQKDEQKDDKSQEEHSKDGSQDPAKKRTVDVDSSPSPEA